MSATSATVRSQFRLVSSLHHPRHKLLAAPATALSRTASFSSSSSDSSRSRSSNSLLFHTDSKYLVYGLIGLGAALAAGLSVAKAHAEEEAPENPDDITKELPIFSEEKDTSTMGWAEWFDYVSKRCVYYFQNPSHYIVGDVLLPESPFPHFSIIIDPKDLLFIEITEDGKKRAKTRPGLDYFLNRISPYYEIIMWSSDPNNLLESDMAKKLNESTGRIITHFLWYGDTTYFKSKIVKDLRRLNRDMSHVFNVTSAPDNAFFQPENLLLLKEWDGNDEDTTLLDLATFLESTASRGLDQDVRLILQKYKEREVDIIEAWKPIRIRSIQQMQEKVNRMEEQKKKKKKSIWNSLY